jgi:tetratricopeptide (TPR) repeat protein
MPSLKSYRGIALLSLALLLATPSVFGQSQTNKVFAARAEQDFLHRQAALAAAPDDQTNCWQFARACFDWADFATNDDQRASVANLGIAAARHLIATNPTSAAGHYYLGMDYGQLAQATEPSLQAFHLVPEMEQEFKLSDELDPHFDYAGPGRNLGLLYRDAPGWPLSIGDRDKARDYLAQAAKRDPEYPENLLNLAESQLHWHQQRDAAKSLQKLEAIWPAAQTNFTGEAWEPAWSDWTPRRAALEATLKKYDPPPDGK